jgi:hypothetical protein
MHHYYSEDFDLLAPESGAASKGEMMCALTAGIRQLSLHQRGVFVDGIASSSLESDAQGRKGHTLTTPIPTSHQQTSFAGGNRQFLGCAYSLRSRVSATILVGRMKRNIEG